MQLQELALQHRAAFLSTINDFSLSDPSWFGSHYRRPADWNEFEFKKYLSECEKSRLDWRPKAGRISRTRYVMTDDSGRIFGTGWLRFPLDSISEVDGGNLEVDVPPSLRGQGYGSWTLSLMLFEAVRAGLRRALVTCPAGDACARRVIEKNRGELADTVASTRPDRLGAKMARYWIDFR